MSTTPVDPTEPPTVPSGDEYTGRMLVLLAPEGVQTAVDSLGRDAGLELAASSDFGDEGVDPEVLDRPGTTVVLEEVGVAIVNPDPDARGDLQAIAAAAPGVILAEPERVVYAIAELDLAGYVAGFRDGIDELAERVLAQRAAFAGVEGGAAPTETFQDGTETWGLLATGAASSVLTGKGVKVAVLDTGFDAGHPDFAGRAVVTKSFISGETVDDGHGHGTHCIGTSCGPRQPGTLPRYGIASEATIHAGKVLSNAGSGADGGILAGIDWAIRRDCAVVSMSLGAPTKVGSTFSKVYETVAQRALTRGTLIVAAAGNESRRPAVIAPVGHPANSPSIIAVGALDPNLAVARFSCGGLNIQGGQVDIAAPGVAVLSSVPRPRLRATMSGTSMATPHVAGLAALHAEANPDVRGGALGWLLLQSARRLTLLNRDVGAGLAQAPGAAA